MNKRLVLGIISKFFFGIMQSEALMVQFENMLAKYQDQHLYDYQIAKTIMTNPTRADEDDVLNSVFVDTVVRIRTN